MNRVTDFEKVQEKQSSKLLNASLKLHQQMVALKAMVEKASSEIYELSLIETDTDGKDRKGNYTWYNFDRSIKITVDVSASIVFDDLTIQACQEKLHQFIDEGTANVEELYKAIIFDAFQKSGGRLDAAKVMSLKKYKTRTKSKLYHEAMDLIDKAIRRPNSKSYFKIYVREDDGSYKYVNLNFSSI